MEGQQFMSVGKGGSGRFDAEVLAITTFRLSV
jgi:hypothetical protein